MLTASSRQVALFRRARDTLTIPALVLAVAAALVASAYVLWRPNVLKVAVAADNPVDQQMMRVASELLGAQHASVKLEVLPVANGQDAGSALVNGGADLAVLRSDSAANGQAQTVMMLRQDAAFFVAPKKGKVKRITDLGGRTIGIAGDSARGRRLMAAVLDFYQLPTDDLKLVPVPTGDIAQAFAQKRIDALLSIGAPTAKSVAEVVTEAARGAQELTFIKIEEAKAIAKRFPAIESVEIEQGAFGGRPTRPTESTTTVGYSVRLVAHAGLDTDVIADLVRELVAIRQNVNATVPGAGLMNVPDTDDNSSFVVHPGVKTYANGDRSTFMDRYSDWIYLGLFAASGIGSVFAGAIGWFKTQRRNEARGTIGRACGHPR